MFRIRAIHFCFSALLIGTSPAQNPQRPRLAGKARQPLARMELRTIRVGTTDRTYWVAAPVEAGLAVPIILMFHSVGGSGESIARVARIHMAAGARRSFVIYPNGLDKNWNDGRNPATLEKGREDVLFVRAILDEVLKADRTLDRSRIYAAGLGSGGFLVQRLGCELSDRIAAIAPVAATFPVALQASCKPAEPMPVLMLHGDADRQVPATGGLNTGSDANSGPALPAMDAFEHWRKVNGCTGEVKVEERAGPPAVTLRISKPCREGAEVRYLEARGVGHTWQEDAGREIAEFLFRFRRTPRF